MDTVEPWVVVALMFAVSGAAGLIVIWREDTWRGRLETLRADFGHELKRRDSEIARLNGMVEALVLRSGMTFNADGDVNVGGDASGRNKIVTNLDK